MNNGFNVWNNHGFSIKFDNDVIISIQFSDGNYCETPTPISDGIESRTAEIAIISDGKFITGEFPGHDGGDPAIMGWCTPDTVAAAIEFARTYRGA